jgi:hypothetical protein
MRNAAAAPPLSSLARPHTLGVVCSTPGFAAQPWLAISCSLSVVRPLSVRWQSRVARGIIAGHMTVSHLQSALISGKGSGGGGGGGAAGAGAAQAQAQAKAHAGGGGAAPSKAKPKSGLAGTRTLQHHGGGGGGGGGSQGPTAHRGASASGGTAGASVDAPQLSVVAAEPAVGVRMRGLMDFGSKVNNAAVALLRLRRLFLTFFVAPWVELPGVPLVPHPGLPTAVATALRGGASAATSAGGHSRAGNGASAGSRGTAPLARCWLRGAYVVLGVGVADAAGHVAPGVLPGPSTGPAPTLASDPQPDTADPCTCHVGLWAQRLRDTGAVCLKCGTAPGAWALGRAAAAARGRRPPAAVALLPLHLHWHLHDLLGGAAARGAPGDAAVPGAHLRPCPHVPPELLAIRLPAALHTLPGLEELALGARLLDDTTLNVRRPPPSPDDVFCAPVGGLQEAPYRAAVATLAERLAPAVGTVRAAQRAWPVPWFLNARCTGGRDTGARMPCLLLGPVPVLFQVRARTRVHRVGVWVCCVAWACVLGGGSRVRRVPWATRACGYTWDPSRAPPPTTPTPAARHHRHCCLVRVVPRGHPPSAPPPDARGGAHQPRPGAGRPDCPAAACAGDAGAVPHPLPAGHGVRQAAAAPPDAGPAGGQLPPAHPHRVLGCESAGKI